MGEEFGKQIQKLQDRTKRIEELKTFLEDHYQNDLINTMRGWFLGSDIGRVQPEPLRYDVAFPTASATYHPNDKSTIQELSEPARFSQEAVGWVVTHLRIENGQEWDNWTLLKEKT